MFKLLKCVFILDVFQIVCGQMATVLNKNTAPVTSPFSIVSDRWYSAVVEPGQHVSMMIDRPSNDVKLSVVWESVNPEAIYNVLFSWDQVPFYDRQTQTNAYSFFISDIGEDGNVNYPINGVNDIYQCESFVVHCTTYQEDAHVGPLYISITALSGSAVNFGKFKFVFAKPNSYIKPDQLNTIKQVWNDCCKPTYTPHIPIPITGASSLIKSRCDWPLLAYLENHTDENEICDSIDNLTCDSDGNVIGLYIPRAGLQCSGFLHKISPLTKLVSINVIQNHLADTIENLKLFSDLTHIALYDNQFYGQIPCDLNPEIASFELGLNYIGGVLPGCLNKLTKVKVFDVKYNPFDLQMFPTFINEMINLENLVLRSANLQGPMPDITVDIEFIDVSDNELTGSLPAQLLGSDRLIYADFAVNAFTGVLPSVGPNVIYANLYHNQLYGDITHVLHSASFHMILDISHNDFSGLFPEEAFNFILSKQGTLAIRGNKFLCTGTNLWEKRVTYLAHILNIDSCVVDVQQSTIAPSPEPTDAFEPCAVQNNESLIIGIVIASILGFISVFVAGYIIYKILSKKQICGLPDINYGSVRVPDQLHVESMRLHIGEMSI
jgi:hypothetical protein